MYEYLEGRVVAHGATRLVLDVGGVGYELAVPLGLRLTEGEKRRIHTHLVVRQDAHLLYGFGERSTRELFRLLLSVRGVGPAVALAILSGLPGPQLVQAVLDDDASTLVQVKGIGRKTAQQILLDLRDRMQQLAPLFPGLAGAADGGVMTPMPPPADQRNVADAVAALLSIGFNEKAARKNVEEAAAEVGAEDLERLVRAALNRG